MAAHLLRSLLGRLRSDVEHGYHPQVTGSSAAWLARSVRDAEVGGSNPLSPTSTPYGRFPSLNPVNCAHRTGVSDNVEAVRNRAQPPFAYALPNMEMFP